MSAKWVTFLLVLGLAAANGANAGISGPTCRQARAGLQVLGSGGPMNPQGRASTSYLLWWMGRPAILVDLGPGSVASLARAGVSLADIDLVLISHLHPDHVSDLPGLLWDEDVAGRNRPLVIVGPAGAGDFPGIQSYLERLFGAQGAFPFMRDILDPHSKFHVEVQMVDITPVQRAPVRKEGGDLAISAYPVPHGKAPSLAYRIDAGGRSVVFASDQNGTDAGFAGFARQADVLVLHTGLSAAAQKHPFAKSIGTPQSLAALAAASGAKHVVLSHLMQAPSTDPQAGAFSLFDPNSLLAAVRSTYHGDVSLASDLECVILDK